MRRGINKLDFCCCTTVPKFDIKSTNFEQYWEIFSIAITKVAKQLLRLSHKIDKVKSLNGIVMNNLCNIANNKYFPREWREIIKDDKIISDKVISTMVMLNIIEISEDRKKLNIFTHKLAEFEEINFNEEEFKSKVISIISFNK